ncbi:ras GTPase-activating protein [Mycena floridula]|nr:ras GTPase-activating protein [Mycena floridula]
MERSNSAPVPNPKSPAASGPFAYQTRLLERTTSVTSRTGASLSRSNSGMSILTNPTGGSTNSTGTRRWTPSHRVTNSLDVVRGKWEERGKAAAAADDNYIRSASPTKDLNRNPTNPTSSVDFSSSSSSSSSMTSPPFEQRTPTALKRHTMPSPIIASPLSPNSTGISVEAESISSDPFSTPTRKRIYLPSYNSSSANDSIFSSHEPSSASPSRPRFDSTPSSTRDTPDAPVFSSISPSRPFRDPFPKAGSPQARPRPTSLYGLPDKVTSPTPLSAGARTTSFDNFPSRSAELPSPASSVMSPPVYRSSYMQTKKSYGSNLRAGSKLGNHLPRIASGDGQDEEPVQNKPDLTRQKREARMARLNGGEMSPAKAESAPKLAVSANDVVGVPGRVRFARDRTPSNFPKPAPSSLLVGGLWADVQRHLLQAYEYLCHVGEAQQWIEGCLGEELGFGVVEMDDGLRNGVVLAKLVREFQGEAVVRKIYEAPKLDFRHSDNINYFFNFVRDVGLPEGFIFELTDLYEKKNLPKVIYCIHALSHLLARRGLAERIGNLLGLLKFSDDQLLRTQKGLKDSGVAMPNFGNVGKELAKDLNEEPDPESEAERRDRLLIENEASILALQARGRGHLARRAHAALHGQMVLAEPRILKLQAHCRGALVRRGQKKQSVDRQSYSTWAVAMQASARAILARRQWQARLRLLQRLSGFTVKVQAQIRGVLQRRRFAKLRAALLSSNFSVVKLQSLARARMVRQSHRQIETTFARPEVLLSVVALQAHARGLLVRRADSQLLGKLHHYTPVFTAMQAHCRGAILRRRMRTQLAKLEDVSHTVIRIQAATRTYLSRKRLLLLIRGLRQATPLVIGFQARARANLRRQQHQSLNMALTEVKTLVSVGGFQALARASLARNRHKELARQLEFAAPDVVGIQAAARGAMVRNEYFAWRDHLHANHHVATLLQALLRGALERRSFRKKLDYFRTNLNTFVKIQSLFRAKETREQYRQLTLGKNVTVGTIKNFVHLLDDSEADFKEELKLERLRKDVVRKIRANQTLEKELNELDVKIGLVVQNVKSVEDVIKTRRRGTDATVNARILADHGDPFSGATSTDKAARRKLELYQQLFYLLQSQRDYLSRLFIRLSQDDAIEKNRRFAERAVLTLFGYGQDRREEFLLLKLFQLAIHDEIGAASTLQEVADGHPMYLNIAVLYVRPKQGTYARGAFQAVIRALVESIDEDLEADPCQIHRSRIEMEETTLGTSSGKEKRVTFHEASKDPNTRAEYIRHLQRLQFWVEKFVSAITASTKLMPYSMRYLARETLISLRERFPDAPQEHYAACLGRLVYYRYINPVIITPEVFEIVSKTVHLGARKNLHQVSKILTQITSGSVFSEDAICYVPINLYVEKAIKQISAWLIEVADVPEAEAQFHAHEFLDATVQPKAIYISPNEIYMMQGLLIDNIESLAPPDEKEPLRVILKDLGGVPNLDHAELSNARDIAVTLELTNRFDVIDPHAKEKTLWMQAKRAVLAVLRVQPAPDLWESLMRPVTDNDEYIWNEILEVELENEARQMPRRQPSAVEPEYRLQDIRELTFVTVKSVALSSLLDLEKLGKITRNDGFQGILNAIASDVRSKHRKRIQRQQEMESMHEALRHLAEREAHFKEQIDSYNSYVGKAMNTMQSQGGKRRFVIPFSKQYFHLRNLQKTGETPQFGSFLYSAKTLYEKSILLSIDQYSPRQFDKIQLTMSSDAPGVFSFILESTIFGPATRLASDELTMDLLLQKNYTNDSILYMFGKQAKFDSGKLLNQINKKFYV